MSDLNAKTWEGAIELDLDQIEPDPMNVNSMSPAQFNELVDMIKTHGFDEPIQVAPIAEKKTPDGRQVYVIIGGEHRWRAMKVLGGATVPAVVKQILDEGERRMLLVKRNVVRGEIDRAKFTTLVKDLEEKSQVGRDLLASKMGFTGDQHMKRFFREEKKATNEQVSKLLEESRRELMTVGNVSYVVSEICAKYGKTMPNGYVFFAHRSRLHLLLQMEAELYQAVQAMCALARRDPKTLSIFLNEAIRSELKKWNVDPDTFKPGDEDLSDSAPVGVSGEPAASAEPASQPESMT